MPSVRANTIVCVSWLLLTVACGVPAQESPDGPLAARGLERRRGSDVNYYPPLKIPLQPTPLEPLRAEPRYRCVQPLYGALRLGDGEDTLVTVVVDEDPDGKESRLYVDRNNDEDLTNDGDGAWEKSNADAWHAGASVQVPYRQPGGGEVEREYHVRFWRFKTRLRDAVFFTRETHVAGTLVLGGRSFPFALLDDNGDGRFDDLEKGALLIDRNGDGVLPRDSSSAEHYATHEPFELGGRGWRLVSVTADGLEARFEPAADVVPKPYLEEGHPAPAFEAIDLAGRPVSLADYRDRVLLLDFWATWCGPCMEEMPNVERIWATYREQGFDILGISLDTQRDALESYLEANPGVGWRQVFDGRSWKGALVSQFRVSGIPDTFLIGRDGAILARGLRGRALELRVAALLTGGPPAEVVPTGPARPPAGTLPAERRVDVEGEYDGRTWQAWMKEARSRIAAGEFERAIECLYPAKFANPEYRRRRLDYPRPADGGTFEEETLTREAFAALGRSARAPAGANVAGIPNVPGNAPTIDGRIMPGEWDGALEVAFGKNAPATLYVLANGERLFVACDARGERTASGFDQLRLFLHPQLTPLLRFALVSVSDGHGVAHAGRVAAIRWKGAPPQSEAERWKNWDVQEDDALPSARGASQFLGHRHYELSIDLAEAGIHPGAPFSLHAELETDPVLDAQGGFKNRAYLGNLGTRETPVWWVIPEGR